MEMPRIALTLGDPTGIGPEVIVGAWSNPRTHACCRPLVVGQPEWLREAIASQEATIDVVEVNAAEDAYPTENSIPCLAASDESFLDIPRATVDARGGQLAFDALKLATDLALSGEVDAITTAPLHKAALNAAGHDYPGHTEMLADFCHVDDVAMMLYLPPGDAVAGSAGLGVIHATLHTALRSVFDLLTVDRIASAIRLADQSMRQFTLPTIAPRIATCALNPHAGEHGLFGTEERELIAPAIQLARSEGIDVEGPLATDTLMPRAAQGHYDAVVAMYHDQGHIALKLLGMYTAVNVTLGLPIIRTSVAHGTAFDLAWQGKANSAGMVSAIEVAAMLASQNIVSCPPTSIR